MTATPLKLAAQTPDDLQVISAALQDAVGKLGDFLFEPRARRFTLVLNRYRWEAGRSRGHRIRAALQIDAVLSAQSRRLKQNAPDAVVSLLTIQFEADAEPPGGELVFTFSGGGELRLAVECLELALVDISEPWRAAARPSHDGPEGDQAQTS
ncbi:MAG: DUF2948 family protein [Pseudomonadota bacterium]